MKRLVSALILLTIFLATLVPTAAQSGASCKVGLEAPAFGFWNWSLHSTVRVYILIADFQSDEVPYLLAPVHNWNSVSEATGSGVKLLYAGSTSSPLLCENCLTIMRGHVFDKTGRHATELRAYSARQDQVITYASIVIDPALTNPKALAYAVAHELGHNFGLLDCFNCKEKSTVMNQFKFLNGSNDMAGPTACDIAQVKAAYKELARRVRPSPQTEDAGEEPIDDDTPIVVPRP